MHWIYLIAVIQSAVLCILLTNIFHRFYCHASIVDHCSNTVWRYQKLTLYAKHSVTSYLLGRQSSGRQTFWATVHWATNQPGDSHLGDNFWTSGRHQLGHLGNRWHMTHVGSRDNNLYKVLSLKGKVLRWRRARQQQVESKLYGLWQKFAAGEISASKLLRCCSHLYTPDI